MHEGISVPDHPERRRGKRIRVATGAVIKVGKDGRIVRTTTVNLGGSGALLRPEEPIQLAVGDELSCECRLPEELGGVVLIWRKGKVVRVEDGAIAVEFDTGVFWQ